MKDTGGPAFPTIPENYMGMDPPGEGMTLRDYFAAKAMQAAIAGLLPGNTLHNISKAEVANFSEKMADAMLKARSQ